jgi:hypothetical protein
VRQNGAVFCNTLIINCLRKRPKRAGGKMMIFFEKKVENVLPVKKICLTLQPL